MTGPSRVRAILLAAFAAAACGAQSTERPTGPKLGENVLVRIDSAVRLPADTTTVRFTQVTSDSRCPSGAQCVWAGEATIVLTVGGTQQVTLRLAPGSPESTAVVGMFKISFVDLAPYPQVEKPRAKGGYVATLRFDSAAP